MSVSVCLSATLLIYTAIPLQFTSLKAMAQKAAYVSNL